MKKYNHQQIEKRWQAYWEKNKTFFAKDFAKKPKKYVLTEFPYPSGEGLHMGHLRPYVAGDVYSRYNRLQGKEVIFPIGWDAFGLPAENFAIKKGVHPSISTKKNIANAKKQLQSWGTSFDWSREINTTDPGYYKWTQWLFLQFYKAGLAYEATGMINWCPKDKTGLANEEVVDGKCERCGTVVEKKELRQWYLKITAYAEKLLQGLKNLPEWPEAVKLQQENWIGKSTGAEISFPVIASPNASEGAAILSQGKIASAALAMTDNKPNFLILHGRASTSKDNFYPWLKKELETRGFEVQVPNMPGQGNPDDLEQTKYVIKNCKLNEQTVVIGHSMGGIVALRLLEKGIKPHRVILVSAPFSGKFMDGKKRPTVTASCEKGFDFKTIVKNCQNFTCLYSLNDVVPMSDGETFAENLQTNLIKVKSQEYHFCGKEELEVLAAVIPSIKVFTTRPDTIFGATYMVVAPEHPVLENFKFQISNFKEVQAYVEKSKGKTEIDRSSEGKEKTGVELKGIKVVNPATKQEIPVWVADYVLWGYGTGAIMAVPAHDERDFEFAKEYKLPITQVVAPEFLSQDDPPKPELPFVDRNAVACLVRNPKTNEYLCLQWQFEDRWKTFVTGGVEEGENVVEACRREILEETGYKNLKFVELLGEAHDKFYHQVKKENRHAYFQGVVFDLENEEAGEVAVDEQKKHKPVWVKDKDVRDFVKGEVFKYFWDQHKLGINAFADYGVVINSGKFDGMKSEEALPKMGEEFGKLTVQYKLRDWVFSRQRYWGEPIPLIHCDKCGIVEVPEKDLPVKLPPVKKYEPTGTGESPLAGIAKWVNVKCPKCKGPAKRETNTMPQWAGSSWYWLRYADSKNKKEFAGKKKLKYWTPVDVYFGGMEHTTLHLLYSRFWNLFFYDKGLVTTKEPYAMRKPHGIVLASDGEKMSKSRGNVVNPDIIVKSLGADTLRMYEMFLGPHELSVSWNDQGVVGVKRFLDRVWTWVQQVESEKLKVKSDTDKTQRALHKLIKKVTEDLENFHFNTCISAFMEFYNEVKSEPASLSTIKTFLILMYPFAPHICEELNQLVSGSVNQLIKKSKNQKINSLQFEKWPKFNPALAMDKNVEIAVQINGKFKGKLAVAAGSTEEHIKQGALMIDAVKNAIGSLEIKRLIYVPNRLINFVI